MDGVIGNFKYYNFDPQWHKIVEVKGQNEAFSDRNLPRLLYIDLF